jgi:hypothetical protein
MKRFALLPALALVLSSTLAFAQAPPPAEKAKFIPPVKTTATIDVQRVSQKRASKEIVTTIKVRNTSKGSINLLRVDQYWYDKSSKQVSFGAYAHKKAPMQPGEVVEIKIVAPDNSQINHDLLMFKHAYGKVEAKAVKKIE